MKYGSLKGRTEKRLHIPVTSKGLNLSDPADALADGQLSFCKNVIYENKSIKTRSGFYCENANVLQNKILSLAESYEYYLTDAVFSVGGEYKRIAAANVRYDISNYFCMVYLIGADASVTSVGYMHFQRVDDSTFYYPDNIKFYVGKPQNGGGIFALVSLKNEGAPDMTDSRIYEINASLDSWEMVYDFYIPTVYINGRGNAYETAKASNQAFTGTPKVIEALNLLEGRFYAYYTSDGYSSSFRLPYSKIADSSVNCRIYYNLESYTEWTIEQGKTSASQEYFGVNVTMNIDREKGNVYFTVEAGEYAVPLMSMYRENNIRITAVKEPSVGIDTLVTAKCSAVTGSRTVFSGCKDKNRLYYTTYENPLYFPEVFENAVGSADSSVVAIKTEKANITAFKPKGIYSLTIKDGGVINTISLLADNGSVFYNKDSFNVKCINSENGTALGRSTAFCMGRALWLGLDRNIYLMTTSANEIYNISSQIKPFLDSLTKEEIESAFGFCEGNNYILFMASKAVIIKFDHSGLSGSSDDRGWYIWEMPSDLKVIGALSFDGKTAFLCKNAAGNICYTASLSGNCDCVISNNGLDNKITYHNIQTVIKTKSYNLGSLKRAKRINSVIIRLEAEHETEIDVFDGLISDNFIIHREDFYASGENTVKLMADLYGVQSVGIGLKSNNGITLRDIDIYYTE